MATGEDPGTPAGAQPPGLPDGFFLGDAAYRSYVLFAATAVILALDALIVLRAAQVLRSGQTLLWVQFLETFRSPMSIVISTIVLLCTLFFSVRWLRVDTEAPTLRLSRRPTPPAPLVLGVQFGGLCVVSALLLLLLGGVIP
jgi:fumarate reductase subunit C